MNKYNSINNAINKINLNADEELFSMQNKLRDCLHKAANCCWTKEELTEYMFDDNNDALSHLNQNAVYEETALWADVRETQHDIINLK